MYRKNLLWIFLFVAIEIYAEILKVPTDYLKIQTAIDIANTGDTVLVEPGTYYENLRIINKNIVLAGTYLFNKDTNMVAQTIINGRDSLSVCFIDSCDNLNIIGLSIIKGKSLHGWGGGIHVRNSNIGFSNLKVHENYANRVGGMYFDNCIANINNTLVQNNVSYYDEGSGIYCNESELIIKNSDILFNKRGGVTAYYSTINMDSCNIGQNLAQDFGGAGITGYQSIVDITNLKVSENAEIGISLNDCNSKITNSIICRNTEGGLRLTGNAFVENVMVYDNNGPGISSRGFIKIYDSSIFNNHSTWSGGGVDLYSTQANVHIKNTKIYSNSALKYGGGLSFWGDLPLELENVVISDNYALSGGGTYVDISSYIQLKDVTIKDNKAHRGGGLFIASGIDKIFLKGFISIYSNYAGEGNEIYYDLNGRDQIPILNVTIDTFTVSEVTADYAFPKENFNIDIKNYKFEKKYAENIYISLDGNDSNNGLYPDQPLKSIHKALNKIKADSINPCTINIAPGEYKYSDHDIFFPLNMMDYVRLNGTGKDEVIFNGNSSSNLLAFSGDEGITVQNISLINGDNKGGGAIYATNSHFCLDSIRILNNNATDGGGIYLNNSYLTANALDLEGNTSISEGGALYSYNSDIDFGFSLIKQNIANNGGAFVLKENSKLKLRYTLVADNEAESRGGALYSCSNSSSALLNTTFANNVASNRGGFYNGWNTKLFLVNSILWQSSPSDIYLSSPTDSVFIYNSNIMSGPDSLDANDKGYIYWAESNIVSNPMINNDDYSLVSSSPCINAGTDFFVFNNDTLLNLLPGDYYGSAPDIGAYEFLGPTYLKKHDLPVQFNLHQNYPNPFNPSTIINYQLSMNSNVKLIVYDALGREVRTLVNKKQPAGEYKIAFDATGLASGIYYYKLKTDGFVQTRKMLLLR